MKRELDCGGPCNHTDAEHGAFDSGLEAGERGADMFDDCPYPVPFSATREAWQTGHSVGTLTRRARGFLVEFADIPVRSPFYDESGEEWRKADEQWAVRASDGAQMPFRPSATFSLNPRGASNEVVSGDARDAGAA